MLYMQWMSWLEASAVDFGCNSVTSNILDRCVIRGDILHVMNAINY